MWSFANGEGKGRAFSTPTDLGLDVRVSLTWGLSWLVIAHTHTHTCTVQPHMQYTHTHTHIHHCAHLSSNSKVAHFHLVRGVKLALPVCGGGNEYGHFKITYTLPHTPPPPLHTHTNSVTHTDNGQNIMLEPHSSGEECRDV